MHYTQSKPNFGVGTADVKMRVIRFSFSFLFFLQYHNHFIEQIKNTNFSLCSFVKNELLLRSYTNRHRFNIGKYYLYN